MRRAIILTSLIDLAGLALLLAAYYGWPLLAPGLIYHSGDPTLLTYPNRFLLREGLLNGILPLWNPYAGLGVPALAEYQGAFLYPFSWAAALIAPMKGTWIAVFFHLWIQAAGMYGLTRHGFGLGRAGAFFAGTALAVCAWNAAHIEQAMIVCAASWTPLILWGWVAFLKRPSCAAFAATTAALAMAILAGHSQYWLYALNVMALLLIFDPFAQKASWRGKLRRKAHMAAALAGIALGAFCLTAAQLLPTLELASRSERMIDPPEYGMHASFPPEYLAHYIAPLRQPPWYEVADPFRNPVEMAVFIGRVTLLLAMAGLLMLWRRRISWVLLAWFAAGLILSFGHYFLGGQLFRAAESLLPGWEGMRVPARLLFTANIALIILAAFGLHAIGELLRKRRRWAGALAIACAMIVIAEQAPLSHRLPLRHATPFTPPPAETSLSAYLPHNNGEYRIFRLILDSPPITAFDSTAHAARIATLEPNTAIHAGAGTVRAFVEGLLPLLRTEDFVRAFYGSFYSSLPDAELLGVMNVRYLATDRPIAGDAWTPVGQLPRVADYGAPITIYENARFRQRVFTQSSLSPAYNPANLEGAYEHTGHASAKTESTRPIPEGPVLNPAIVAQTTTNALAVQLGTRADGPLLLAQSPYPGWRAIWPGGATPLEPVNAIHSQFTIPPDVDTFELRFEPFSFRLGLFLSLVSLGLAAAWLWLTKRPAQS